jgi:hypothetical protein
MSRPARAPRRAEVPAPPADGAHFITLADQVRKWGMVLLLWAFVGTAGLSLAAVLLWREPRPETLPRPAAGGGEDRELVLSLADRSFDHLKQILQILLPAETALLGSAMGFYYGSQAKGGEG